MTQLCFRKTWGGGEGSRKRGPGIGWVAGVIETQDRCHSHSCRCKYLTTDYMLDLC